MKGGRWHFDNEIVYAIWTLVRMCGSDDGSTAGALVSDFISRVMISYMCVCVRARIYLFVIIIVCFFCITLLFFVEFSAILLLLFV